MRSRRGNVYVEASERRHKRTHREVVALDDRQERRERGRRPVSLELAPRVFWEGDKDGERVGDGAARVGVDDVQGRREKGDEEREEGGSPFSPHRPGRGSRNKPIAALQYELIAASQYELIAASQ